MKKYLISFILILSVYYGYAQHKFEKEYRIKPGEVPENASGFVDSMNFNNKVRWYKEIGYDKISYEAKTNYKGEKYSIEFSENGAFEDVEIEINPEKIPSTAFSIMTEYLSSMHNKYSVDKIQVQYSGNPSSILAFIKHKNTENDVITRYEILISTKVDGTFVMIEYLFSEAGEYIQSSRVVLNRTDNIEY